MLLKASRAPWRTAWMMISTSRGTLNDIIQNRRKILKCGKGVSEPHSPCFAQTARTCSSVANSPRSACARDSSNEASSSELNGCVRSSSPANCSRKRAKASWASGGRARTVSTTRSSNSVMCKGYSLRRRGGSGNGVSDLSKFSLRSPLHLLPQHLQPQPFLLRPLHLVLRLGVSRAPRLHLVGAGGRGEMRLQFGEPPSQRLDLPGQRVKRALVVKRQLEIGRAHV